MEGFITWSILGEYVSFITSVYLIVEFTKNMPFIKKLSTKYWSAIISFILLVLVNLHSGSFATWDLTLYALSAISISLGANGLSNFNAKKQTTDTSTIIDNYSNVIASDATSNEDNNTPTV